MTTFNILGIRPDGKLWVRSADGAIDGVVAAPSLSGPYFDNDETVETSEGTATKSGSSWQLTQGVETDSSSVSGTVLYNARWLGLPRWTPRHVPPKKVQIGTVEVTYNGDGTPTVEGTDGSFTGGGRTWNLAEIAGDRSAFIRAKADHDWEQRTPSPPKAQHTPNVQYVGAANVLLNRDPALTPYFGRPEARRLPDGKYEEKSSRFSWLSATWTEGELELRDRDGAVTDEQRGQWGSATVGWTDNVADVSSSEGSVDSAAVGAKQRLRIRVPDVYTQMTLGEAYRDQDGQGFAFPGFGVETDGHVFISAKKDAGSSTATLQAKGDVIIQSEAGKLWAGALGDSNLASTKNTFVMGGTGVVIAGGAAVTWADNPDSDGTTPKPPGWMGGFSAGGSTISQVWSGIDAAVAVGTGIKGVVAVKTGRPKGLDFAIAVANLTLGNLGGGIVSGLGAANADPIGGTIIHGTGGVIVGSTHTMGLYSLTGTTIASVLGVCTLAPSVGVTGFNDATLESGRTVDVKSGGVTNVVAHRDLLMASRTALAKLLGATIEIGSKAGSAPQLPTSTLKIATTSSILASSDYVEIEGIAGGGVTVKAPKASFLQESKHHYAEATEDVDIRQGAWKLRLTSSVAQIGKAGGASFGSDVSKGTNAGAVFTGSEAAIFCSSFGARFTSSQASIGNSSDYLIAQSGKVKVKAGGKILLG